MKLSIIIPVYNASATVCRSLDSIYSQGLDPEDFEVICIDDCSTDNSVEVLRGYCYAGAHPGNLRVVRHLVNKRQGGGRNTGIEASQGEWLLFLDDDDFFVEGALKKLLAAADAEPGLDTIMFDCCVGDGKSPCTVGDYARKNLDTAVMTGVEFLQKIPVPWTPWCYLYRRDHLLSTGFSFVENVRFEDVDFVLKYTARSLAIRFLPLVVYYHTVHPNQTSYICDDPEKIRDSMRIIYRMFEAAVNERRHSIEAGNAIMGHTIYAYRMFFKRIVWRLHSFRDVRSILSECRFTESTGDGLVDFANRHIVLTSLTVILARPFLCLVYRIYKIIRRK